MKISTMGQLTKEGVANVWKNRMMSLASLIIVIATLFVFGLFIVLSFNMNNFVGNLENKFEIMAYLDKNISHNNELTVGNKIKKLEDVKSIKYISKKDAIKIMNKQWKVDKSLLKDLEKDTPIPSSYDVKLNSAKNINKIAQNISKIRGVDKVRYSKDTVRALLKINTILKGVSIVIVIILGIISIFIIANTVKLTVFARRREINIMKMIGATDAFIRWPFVIEGLVIGFLGAILSFILTKVLYSYAYIKVFSGVPFLKLLPFIEIQGLVLLYYVVAGTMIGGVGSYASVKKHLHV